MPADPLLMRWYAFVKAQRCCSCGAYPSHEAPVEAAHVRVLLSSKTGMVLPRSHKGRAAWSVVALCRPCHLAQHESGEAGFPGQHMWPHMLATNLVRFFVEQDGS